MCLDNMKKADPNEEEPALNSLNKTVCSVEKFLNFLERFKFVTIADLSWIQGCESEVVVACIGMNCNTLESTVLWPLVSRSPGSNRVCAAALSSTSSTFEECCLLLALFMTE